MTEEPWYGHRVALSITSIAGDGIRTLRAFGSRIPLTGGLLAGSLEEAVSDRVILITGAEVVPFAVELGGGRGVGVRRLGR